MKNMKKIMMTIITLCMATCSLWAQNEVSLVVSGEGQDKEDATLKALRSAIEQAYGTFVSANTTVLNDRLVADEIVSLSSGNIQKYEYVSEAKMPDGSTFVTLSTTVSIDKLVAFAESKGMEAELKGGLFAMNIKKMEFDKQAEEKAVANLCKQLEAMLPTLFDYEIEVEEPKKVRYDTLFFVHVKITASPSNNFDIFVQSLYKTLTAISLSENEMKNYEKLNYELFGYDIGLLGWYLAKFGISKECYKCDHYLCTKGNSSELLSKLKELGFRKIKTIEDESFFNGIELRSYKSVESVGVLRKKIHMELYNILINNGISSILPKTSVIRDYYDVNNKTSYEGSHIAAGLDRPAAEWYNYDFYKYLALNHVRGKILILNGNLYYSLNELAKISNISVSKRMPSK